MEKGFSRLAIKVTSVVVLVLPSIGEMLLMKGLE